MLGMAVSFRGASFSRRRGLTKDAAHEFVEEPCVLRTASPSSPDKVWLDLQSRAEFPKDRYGDSKHSIPYRAVKRMISGCDRIGRRLPGTADPIHRSRTAIALNCLGIGTYQFRVDMSCKEG